MKNLIHLSLSLTLVLALAPYASADNECETDADCPSGLICVEGQGDDDPAETKPAPPVEVDESTDSEGKEGDAEESDAAAVEPPVEEEAETFKYCDLKSCESDADCGDGTVCVVLQMEECDSAPVLDVPLPAPAPEDDDPKGDSDEGGDESDDFAPEEKGEAEGDENCEVVELQGFCGPQWLAPCEVDADCGGTGFTCVEEEVCWSTGGGGSASSSGSAGGMPTEPTTPEEGKGEAPSESADDEGDDEVSEESGCEGLGTFYCEIQEIACTDSADCPADWDCLENPEVAVSVSLSVPCDVDDEGNEDCPEPAAEPEKPAEPADISSLCFPPGYDDYANWGGGDLSAIAESSANDSGTSTDGGASGPDGEQDEGATDKASSSSSDDGGCAGGPQPLSAIWLALALVALAVRRREPIQH